jgi:HD-GYP domain-containing protein (c-di-GMP phosphodiesterase class II)
MSTTRRIVPVSALLLLATPLLLFAILRVSPGLDATYVNLSFHFWSVTGTTIVAAVAGIVVIMSARSVRETRLLFLALAFASIAAIFSIHGLNTPGYYLQNNHHLSLIRVSAYASIFVGSCFAVLSAATLPPRAASAIERFGTQIFFVTVAALIGYIAVSLAYPEWLEWVPTENFPLQLVLSALLTCVVAYAIWRYVEAFLFARLPAQAAMIGALVLLLETQIAMLWGRGEFTYSWWLYHFLYLAAFAVLFAGWAYEAARAGTIKAIGDALSMRDAIAQLERGHDGALLELVEAIELKDVGTHGHVRRVGAYAVAIGHKLGLNAIEMRQLALAAKMHDVGKIGVPDHILKKPGPLNDDEFAEMQQHTERGGQIASRVEMLREVAPVIRAHHERRDGRGYPDGLAGDEIPRLARIISVADTYDAMVSDRPYRKGLAHAEAVAELRRVAGSQLDPVCVQALLAWFDEQEIAAA